MRKVIGIFLLIIIFVFNQHCNISYQEFINIQKNCGKLSKQDIKNKYLNLIRLGKIKEYIGMKNETKTKLCFADILITKEEIIDSLPEELFFTDESNMLSIDSRFYEEILRRRTLNKKTANRFIINYINNSKYQHREKIIKLINLYFDDQFKNNKEFLMEAIIGSFVEERYEDNTDETDKKRQIDRIFETDITSLIYLYLKESSENQREYLKKIIFEYCSMLHNYGLSAQFIPTQHVFFEYGKENLYLTSFYNDPFFDGLLKIGFLNFDLRRLWRDKALI